MVGIAFCKEIEMNLVKNAFSRAAGWIATRMASLTGSHWKWVGDEQHPTLFQRRGEHGEFSVVAYLAIDEETVLTERFSDVWVPGAVLIPPKWKAELAKDIQWYVPRRQVQFGFQTGGAVGRLVKSVKRFYEHIEEDIKIMTGERPLYRIDVQVFFRGECLMEMSENGLAITLDSNMDEADEIMSELVNEAAHAARKTWIYRSMAFSAA